MKSINMCFSAQIKSLMSLLMPLLVCALLGFGSDVLAEEHDKQTSASKRTVLIDARNESGHSDDYHKPYIEQGEAEQAKTPGQQGAHKPLPMIIRVTGYGVYQKKGKEPDPVKRLQAIRASRLDAYRNLAERVYGLNLKGQSQVKDFSLQNDQFAASVDSVVRGARVVSISDNPQTGIETVLELELPADFRKCLNRVNNFRHRIDCMRPITDSLSSTTENYHRSAGSALSNAMEKNYFLK